ncbi:flagellar basal body-associated protein FliL [Thioalkalivibrio sp. K90mix]|jgi:flagellar FliL protein|uniref:flagellar basal body-associated FliL family protein n=1 Tax=Thioalkalivibrio sp. (strain K90mix) TaxID=396595 RepID=UPI000195A60B|nr:flagellar basal body-associated FliL family protein [Thioalkalivibrio sp. K90mix]ADC71673.1 flagellar basal body-associated protein FliL [Thioalkalivibrio sp. K90mix]
MAEKEVELGEEGAGEKGKKGLTWIVILLVLVFAGAGAAAAWFFLSGGDEEETGEEGPAERHYHGLEPMTVNIDGPGRIRYLRLELSVVTTDPEVIAALERHMPAVRNDVLGLLGEKHYDDLNTRDGKESLAEELREAIAEILEERDAPHDVEAVRFNELVMQ